MPAAQAVTEGARQIALARNTGQLRFSPDAQGFDLCCAVLLTSSKADIGRLACNVALDVVKRADTVESLARDLGFVRGPDIMEVTSPMRPAGRFPEAAYAVRSWLIKLPIAFVAVSLKDAACLPEVTVDVLFLPVGSKVVDRSRWSSARPGTLIADIGPDPALLHAFAQPLIPKRTIEHPDRGVVGMEKVTAHDHRLDPLNQRLEHLHGATAPIDQRAVRNVGAHAGEDLVQAIQRQVIVELRDQNVSQKPSTCHAARYRTAGRRQLHHLLAATAGLLQSGDLDDLHLRSDHVEDFAGVLADKAQFTAAIGAAGTRIEFFALARCLFRYPRTAAHGLLGPACHRRGRHCRIDLIERLGAVFRCGD
ncbi:hypothetical protein ACVMB3_004234 [Sinorhizobium meliloti]